jgi:hypothetical protein
VAGNQGACNLWDPNSTNSGVGVDCKLHNDMLKHGTCVTVVHHNPSLSGRLLSTL